MILWLLACGPAEPPIQPTQVERRPVAPARSWVRDVAADASHVYWTSYDPTSGRSERAVLERAPIQGGDAEIVAVERHPPQHLQVQDGYLYWSYHEGSLKRVPVTGGEPQKLVERSARCFDLDATHAYYIHGIDLFRVPLTGGEPEQLAHKVLAECPLVHDGQVYWLERMALFAVSTTGQDHREVMPLKKAEGLQVVDGRLHACWDDKIVGIDLATLQAEPVRDYCKGEGLLIEPGGHWFLEPYYTGWPPQKHARLVQVTSSGPTYLFDGEGSSPAVRSGDRLLWFGSEPGDGWQGRSAPLPGAP